MRGRGERLAHLLEGRDVDVLLVTQLSNVRYLTGFGGTNGACICGPDTQVFLTDFRYTERAEAEVDGWEVITVEGDWLKGIAEHVSDTARVGFEDDHVSVRTHGRLGEAVGPGVELCGCSGLVEGLRRVKDAGELAAIAAAAELADEAYRVAIEPGLAGRTERSVAFTAEQFMREHDAEPSFPSIVAGGPNGALPHAEPGEREIAEGDLVVFDMGAQLDGYCSDCTRTFAAGDPSEDARAVYEIVLRAQTAALEAVRSGVDGKALDAVARDVIEEAGYGDRFGHGLGHGVGLEVHEGPRVSSRSTDTIESGEVVTIEPGIYIPGELGVRIEDLVVVEHDGHKNLSGLDKTLTIV